MNLYQELNRSYREFKQKESISLLKESEEKVVEVPVEELNKEEEFDTEKEIKELSDLLISLEDGLANVTDPEEAESMKKEIEELKAKLNSLEMNESDEDDSEEEEEVETTEVPETSEESETTVEEDLNKLVSIAEEGNLPEMAEELKKIITKLHSTEVTEPTEVENTEVVEEPEEVIEDCDKSDKLNDCDGKCKDEVIEDCDKVKETEIPEEVKSGITKGAEPDVVSDSEEEEELKECEVNAIRILRVSPSNNAYLLETETTNGLTYIVGKNYNSESKIIEEAETFDSKDKASNHFKSLLEK